MTFRGVSGHGFEDEVSNFLRAEDLRRVWVRFGTSSAAVFRVPFQLGARPMMNRFGAQKHNTSKLCGDCERLVQMMKCAACMSHQGAPGI